MPGRRPLILGARLVGLGPHTAAELVVEPQVPFRFQKFALEAPAGALVLDLCFNDEPWLSLELVDPSAGIPAALFRPGADDFFAHVRTAPIPRIEVGGRITLKIRTGAEGGDVTAGLSGETD